MNYSDFIQKNEDLIEIFRCFIRNNSEYKDILRCQEGDFIIYHGIYAEKAPLRFTLHLVKSLFISKKYTLIKNNYGNKTKNSFATFVTAENIYTENLKPIIQELNEKGFKNDELRIRIEKNISLRKALNRNIDFSIIKFFIENKKYLSYKNIIKLLYLKYILYFDCKNLITYLNKNFPKNYSCFLSAEICDVRSRVCALISKSHGTKTILFQPGPFHYGENPEVRSIICDEFIGWNQNKDFFLKYEEKIRDQICKVNFFDAIRYRNLAFKNIEKKYDIVFFLTWLNHGSPIDSINEQMDKVISYILNKYDLNLYLKIHPATSLIQEKEILTKYNTCSFIPKEKNSTQVISKSKMILNFGSTVSFDADYLNVKTGIINFDNVIDDSHQFFSLKNVKNIKNIQDLNFFVKDFNSQLNVKLNDNSIIEHIQKNMKLSNV